MPKEAQYAYGFIDRRFNDVRVVGHNGGNYGVEAKIDIYSETGHVVVLTNQDGTIQPAMQRSRELLTA